jgi:tRNA(fMet)-specific endonuclease VapC
MDPSLLDTDTLSELLKQRNATLVAKAAEYLRLHGRFTFSIFTQFEITRGYKEKRATRQLIRFESFCRHAQILPLTDSIFARAADLWVMARRQGFPHGDADLLIATTALENGLQLATGNTSHFTWIPGLVVKDWRST